MLSLCIRVGTVSKNSVKVYADVLFGGSSISDRTKLSSLAYPCSWKAFGGTVISASANRLNHSLRDPEKLLLQI